MRRETDEDFDDGGTPEWRRRQVMAFRPWPDIQAVSKNERDRRFMRFVFRIVLGALVLFLAALSMFLGQAVLDALFSLL